MARPKGISKRVSGKYKDKKEYNVEYLKACRYVFTTNLSQEKDADIIEALEANGLNRQGTLKELIRAGIKYNKLMDKGLLESGLIKIKDTES